MAISPKYRKMMVALDAQGKMVAIDRISRSQFTFLVNGEAVKSYRSRKSCNRYLVKLFQNHQN